jgi:hypothetical protein
MVMPKIKSDRENVIISALHGSLHSFAIEDFDRDMEK